MQIKFDWRIISGVLLAALIMCLLLWKPWQQAAVTKTISVQGEATVAQAPDLFRFQPVYRGTDTPAVVAKGNEVVARLKQIGVKDADIKTTASSPGAKPQILIYPAPPPEAASASYTIDLTVGNKALAQKVADYLATTSAAGQVTPQAEFSQATRTKLDLDARQQASEDAKTKAGVMAKQLGAKLGKVVQITEDAGFGSWSSRETSSQ